MRDPGRNRVKPSPRQMLLTGLAAAMFAACTPGAATPTGAPTPAGATPVGTLTPATAVPTTAASTPVPSTPPVATPAPTIAGTVDLESLIPDEIGGMTLTKRSSTAEEIFPPGEGQTAFAALLTT